MMNEYANELKRVPYGVDDFVSLRRGSFAYVDKTRFIEVLEQEGIRFPLIVRPRSFGKSLFTNMLMSYYDGAAADQFEQNFKGSYIFDHKTKHASSFCVLYFSFDGISSDDICASFIKSIQNSIRMFLQRYPISDEDAQSLLNEIYTNPGILFTIFISKVARVLPHKLYVIIDEYDHFVNDLLSQDKGSFEDIKSSLQFVRDFFTAIKKFCDEGIVSRVFITGVTSISLDSFTSGFNIAERLNNRPAFASLFGFTHAELKTLIPEVLDLKKYGHSVDEVFARMQELYDGYRFCTKSDVLVFNPSLSLYYLKEVRTLNHEPKKLLDPDLSQALSKIHEILKLGDVDFVKEVVNKAIRHESIHIDELASSINLSFQERVGNSELIATLMYFGYLTYANDSYSFKVPNKTVWAQFFEYYLIYLVGIEAFSLTNIDFTEAFSGLRQGNIESLLRTASEHLKRNRDFHTADHFDESELQTALLAIMFFSDDYKVHAVDEVFGNGEDYAVLVMRAKNEHWPSYLLKLSYLKRTHADDESISRSIASAKTQLERYSEAANLSSIPNLRRLVAVFADLKLKTVRDFI